LFFFKRKGSENLQRYWRCWFSDKKIEIKIFCSYFVLTFLNSGKMETQFIDLCQKGDLIGLKQLLQLHPDINISADNEKAFRNACLSGQLHVCKWLLQVKPDINISALNEYAFRYACYNGHLNGYYK
jgi:hypothetical protein